MYLIRIFLIYDSQRNIPEHDLPLGYFIGLPAVLSTVFSVAFFHVLDFSLAHTNHDWVSHPLQYLPTACPVQDISSPALQDS